jgi:hypothetical protein
MSTFDYIILADDQETIEKHFKAIKFVPRLERTDTFTNTAGGGIDKQAGSILKSFLYTLKVYADAVDPMGSLNDLTTLYSLNNPTPLEGQSSDLIILTDHYGVIHYVKFRDDYMPEPVTTQLEGPNALHYVNVTLIEIPNAGVGS